MTNFIYYTYLDIILLIDLIISTFIADIETLFLWPIDCVTREEADEIFRVEFFSQIKFVRNMHRKRKHTLAIFVQGHGLRDKEKFNQG